MTELFLGRSGDKGAPGKHIPGVAPPGKHFWIDLDFSGIFDYLLTYFCVPGPPGRAGEMASLVWVYSVFNYTFI